MKNQLFNKRIPTILGIGFIVLGIILVTVVIGIQTNLRSNAGNSEEPQNVRITNLSDNSFTITYQTGSATNGSVNYGQKKELGNVQLENIDKEKGSLSPKNIHDITVGKLSPSTKYYLVIVSAQKTFLNNGVPFEISTGPSISSPSASQAIIKGKIILPDGNTPNEALVYLSSENSQLLSTAVAKNGEFNFSLKRFRTDDLSSYVEINENTVLKLFAISNSLKSTILLSGNKTYSIPTITLSNNYDFTRDFVETASRSAEFDSLGFPTTPVNQGNQKPQILTPKKEQVFTDQRPQFQGTSLPNETVEITIHSDENIQTQVISDSNGNWTYRPPANLSPGDHTIIIKTRDSGGIFTTVMQSFTVFAAETPISPTPISILTPTLFPSPTAVIVNPTLLPSPTFAPIESKGGLSPTGSSSILLIIGGIVSTISGIALFLLTRTIL